MADFAPTGQPRSIAAPLDGPSNPAVFTLPQGVAFDLQSVFADIDASAAGDTTATITIADSSGAVIAKKRQSEVVDAGSNGSATWALRLADSSVGGATPQTSELVYRYTVTGVDKASIDTAVDAPAAGSNDWTNSDLLEVFLYARTDESAGLSAVAFTVNNDSGANYHYESIGAISATVTAALVANSTKWLSNVAGANDTAGVFGYAAITLPFYANTVGFKTGQMSGGAADSAGTRSGIRLFALTWLSTAAISRLAVTPATAAKKFKVGTQLVIYKRQAT